MRPAAFSCAVVALGFAILLPCALAVADEGNSVAPSVTSSAPATPLPPQGKSCAVLNEQGQSTHPLLMSSLFVWRDHTDSSLLIVTASLTNQRLTPYVVDRLCVGHSKTPAVFEGDPPTGFSVPVVGDEFMVFLAHEITLKPFASQTVTLVLREDSWSLGSILSATWVGEADLVLAQMQFPVPPPVVWPTSPPTAPGVTESPTSEPTSSPTMWPTEEPTDPPTVWPTETPTASPTQTPTVEPTDMPTDQPTTKPTDLPTDQPTTKPTDQPTVTPTAWPSEEPTCQPTVSPTQWPTDPPTTPEQSPTPSTPATQLPTVPPEDTPTPTQPTDPTNSPTWWPTWEPTLWPTWEPTQSTLEPNGPEGSPAETLSETPPTSPSPPPAEPDPTPSWAPSSSPTATESSPAATASATGSPAGPSQTPTASVSQRIDTTVPAQPPVLVILPPNTHPTLAPVPPQPPTETPSETASPTPPETSLASPIPPDESSSEATVPPGTVLTGNSLADFFGSVAGTVVLVVAMVGVGAVGLFVIRTVGVPKP
jgi:hypothetical protein